MKQTVLTLLLLSSFAVLAPGKVVPLLTAQKVGCDFLRQKGGNAKSPADLQLVFTSGVAPVRFYILSGSNCFVLVAADDAVTPILGYATDAPFRADKMSSNTSGFFETYDRQIDQVINSGASPTPEIAANWRNLIDDKKTTAAKTTDVAPLLATTWDQGAYYNTDCPYDPAYSGLSYTGCVATATAQIMKFWSWPIHGIGLHSYFAPGIGTQSADFGATFYNWPAMPNSVTAPNADVAKLMYHIGVGVDMHYTGNHDGSVSYVISATSPTPNCAEYALKNYFNYDPALHGIKRSDYSDAAWTTMITNELDHGQPVIYAGHGGSGGHCFVFDGYNSPDFFHINWGWSGTDNGYFTIDALNPASLGTGGGTGGFNYEQEAIVGIKPYTGCGANLQLHDYVTPSSASIFYSASFDITTGIKNSSSAAFSGDFCAAAFDAVSGAFITYIDSVTGSGIPPGAVLSPTLSFHTPGVLSMFPGDYKIGIFYREAGCSWVLVPGAGGFTNFAPISVYNHNFIALYSVPAPSPSPLVQSHSAAIALSAYNNSATPWTDQLNLALYNPDGTWNSDIQTTAPTSISNNTSSGLLTFNSSGVTASPGTYLLVLSYKYGGMWYIAGSDFHSNPTFITVTAPAAPPDAYEVNNDASSAYDLTSSLAWSGDVAQTTTPGSNFHVPDDEDYYKLSLPPGYDYAISARVNDALSTDDGAAYSVDAVWSYTTDGAGSWSPVYNDVMPGTINFTGQAGGTVIFHVSHSFAGSTGYYLFKVGSVTRSNPNRVPVINLSDLSIYPNPATDLINIDLGSIGNHITGVSLKDLQGREVMTINAVNQSSITLPVNNLEPGLYLLQLTTESGRITTKVTVSRDRP